MSTQCPSPLAEFAEFVEATDEHASSHVPLLNAAVRILKGEENATAEQRGLVSERLERWRYQMFGHRDGREDVDCGLPEAESGMGRQDDGARGRGRDAGMHENRRVPASPRPRVTPISRQRGLADALDLAANDLAGRPAREPRNLRAWLQPKENADFGVRSSEFASSVVTPHSELGIPEFDTPFEELIQQARLLTRRHFGIRNSEVGSRNQDAGTGRKADAANPVPPRISASPPLRVVLPPQSGLWRMLLYAPLYLSSHCINHCEYCAFRYPNQIPREHLDRSEALEQAEILRQRGLRHILLVAGDFPKLTSTEYFAEIIGDLKQRGFHVAVEIAAQSTTSYAELVKAGVSGLALYQETYHEELYARYHPRGTKVSWDWRVEAPERAAEAGMSRLGLGVLLGLSDPAEDVLAMIRHGRYLQSRFPGVALAFSLPRIHEAPEGFQSPYPVDDETFVRLYCVLRLAFPEAHLVLSTRECAALRQRLAKICITQMSAGSSTVPGGYAAEETAQGCGQQFPLADHRSPAEVARSLQDQGFEVCWDEGLRMKNDAERG